MENQNLPKVLGESIKNWLSSETKNGMNNRSS